MVTPDPIFCRFFIKKGLHDSGGGESAERKGKFSLLNQIQTGYKVVIVYFMRHKGLAVSMGGCAFVARNHALQACAAAVFPPLRSAISS